MPQTQPKPKASFFRRSLPDSPSKKYFVRLALLTKECKATIEEERGDVVSFREMARELNLDGQYKVLIAWHNQDMKKRARQSDLLRAVMFRAKGVLLSAAGVQRYLQTGVMQKRKTDTVEKIDFLQNEVEKIKAEISAMKQTA